MSCPTCQTPIRGVYHGTIIHVPRAVPAFCHECGSTYPWTKSRLQAARDLIELLEGVDESEKTALLGSLDDLIKDLPQTQVAALRVKKLATKLSQESATVLRNLLVDIASETAKKILFPS